MRIALTILFLISFIAARATHNRAGEITYEHQGDYTYKITLITYTWTQSLANESRNILPMEWGDDLTEDIVRQSSIVLAEDTNYTKNVYVGWHTYPGPGNFIISMQDPNRNEGIENIPNSVGVQFSITTELRIDPIIGYNSTPVLLNPPIDRAISGEVFIHNPGAYDPDGDSLSYKLVPCTGNNGMQIDGYTYPESTNEPIYVDEYNGDLIWNTPPELGDGVAVMKFNVAMHIEEWRDGIKIGIVTRDLQIEVYNLDNNPPVIDEVLDLCVNAGELIDLNIEAKDTLDHERVFMSGSGVVFNLANSPAELIVNNVSFDGLSDADFRWQTNCGHVKSFPYNATIKAENRIQVNQYDVNIDEYINVEIGVADIEHFNISVVGPASDNLTSVPTHNTVTLNWDANYCDNIAGYYIYRKDSYYGFAPGFCEVGVPSYTGYQLVGTVDGHGNTTYFDNDNKAGLQQGAEYCYLVTAFYYDGAESYASTEICTTLVKGKPVITNVSVNNTDVQNGAMYVAWSKPKQYEGVPGNYEYVLYRSNDLWGTSFSVVEDYIYDGLDDTTYVDTLINTRDYPFSYKIELQESGELVTDPMIASSINLNINFADNELILDFEKNVAWINDHYVIYRYNNSTLEFDSIGTTTILSYNDLDLVNGNEYCYKVKSIGYYSEGDFINPIVNYSQIVCETPGDTIPPCPPILSVTSNCDSIWNELSWYHNTPSCAPDVVSYDIYYASGMDETYVKVDSSVSYDYIHKMQDAIVGCYAVTAVDSFGNESIFSNKMCVDYCTFFELPNVFSPNGDGRNDLFIPSSIKLVEKLNFEIHNRWGEKVFETTELWINWDGRDMESKQLVSSGVYYYVCEVFERRLTGLEPRYLVGFVHVYPSDEFIPVVE